MAVVVSVTVVDGEQEIVSNTVGVAVREPDAELLTVGVPVVVRVVLILREVVPDPVGEIVCLAVGVAVVEADEETVDSTVPVELTERGAVAVAESVRVGVEVVVGVRVPGADRDGEELRVVS